jgi:hypothetical protein
MIQRRQTCRNIQIGDMVERLSSSVEGGHVAISSVYYYYIHAEILLACIGMLDSLQEKDCNEIDHFFRI